MKKSKLAGLTFMVISFLALLFTSCPQAEVKVADISLSVKGGSYANDITTKVTCKTQGVMLRYTTDGSLPSATKGTKIQNGKDILIKKSVTLKVIAYLSETSFKTRSEKFVLTATEPTFSPDGGSFNEAQNVKLSTATTGAKIHYTTDGTAPLSTSPSVASGATISLSTTATLKAIAIKTGYTNSSIKSSNFTITLTAAEPTFTPDGANSDSDQIVTITTATTGAKIYYTINGDTPTSTASSTNLLYSTPVTIGRTTTLKAIATKASYSDSTIKSAIYTIEIAAPVFTIAAGTYDNDQSVLMSSATSGVIIYYTTDGSTPTGLSMAYSVPVSISATTTLKAIAIKTGFYLSSVTQAVYTLIAAEPTFSIDGGTYSTDQSVTMASTTTGAMIYYTTNGDEPTSTVSTTNLLYASGTPVTISASGTLKAIAIKTGYTNSSIKSADFTLTATEPTFSIDGGTYSTDQSVTMASTTTGAMIYYTTDGVDPTATSTLYASGTPVTISASGTLKAIAIKTGYTNSSIKSADFTLEVEPITFTPNSGSFVDLGEVTIACPTPAITMRYTFGGVAPTTTTGKIVPSNTIVKITSSGSLQVIAYKTGYSSATKSASYTVTAGSIPLITVEGGTFLRGTATITISTFVMGTYEVTQKEYKDVMTTLPPGSLDAGSGDNLPVYWVSWDQAVAFCNALSTAKGLTPCYSVSTATPPHHNL